MPVSLETRVSMSVLHFDFDFDACFEGFALQERARTIAGSRHRLATPRSSIDEAASPYSRRPPGPGCSAAADRCQGLCPAAYSRACLWYPTSRRALPET